MCCIAQKVALQRQEGVSKSACPAWHGRWLSYWSVRDLQYTLRLCQHGFCTPRASLGVHANLQDTVALSRMTVSLLHTAIMWECDTLLPLSTMLPSPTLCGKMTFERSFLSGYPQMRASLTNRSQSLLCPR